ncbi:hypothetical protein [Aequorivita sp. CIP111184]|uniref:hypothetical protein n=1 Tax=Aequorivita sp. CIP111184 TaxID=2211356 RepID=UPI000DBC0C32|nr:hypothetical protein [Aequorivita sp. CIP111184]SRX52729.1 hypothetical protein AEQU1_00598 [Aequorivita sp. CIP111184]
MKSQKNQKRNHKLIVKIILGFIIGISFGFGVGKFFKSEKKLTSSIEKTIQQNCQCESITSNFGAVGIQFSKEDGFSNKKLSFTLINCDYYSSEKEEATRLNEILKQEVENYASVDFISFQFKSEEKNEIVKIKNGSILNQ